MSSKKPRPINDSDIIAEMVRYDFEQLPPNEQFIIQELALDLSNELKGLGETSARNILWAIGRLLNDTRGA